MGAFGEFSLRRLLVRLGGGAAPTAATKPAAPTRVRAGGAPLDVDAVAAKLVSAGAAPVGTPVEPRSPPNPLGPTERESVMHDLLVRTTRAVGHARHASHAIKWGRATGTHSDRLYFDATHLLGRLVDETREYEADLLLGKTYIDQLVSVRVRLEEQRVVLEAARATPK